MQNSAGRRGTYCVETDQTGEPELVPLAGFRPTRRQTLLLHAVDRSRTTYGFAHQKPDPFSTSVRRFAGRPGRAHRGKVVGEFAERFLDFNDLRVSGLVEIEGFFKSLPKPERRTLAWELRMALQDVFDGTHGLDLEPLRARTPADQRGFLKHLPNIPGGPAALIFQIALGDDQLAFGPLEEHLMGRLGMLPRSQTRERQRLAVARTIPAAERMKFAWLFGSGAKLFEEDFDPKHPFCKLLVSINARELVIREQERKREEARLAAEAKRLAKEEEQRRKAEERERLKAEREAEKKARAEARKKAAEDRKKAAIAKKKAAIAKKKAAIAKKKAALAKKQAAAAKKKAAQAKKAALAKKKAALAKKRAAAAKKKAKTKSGAKKKAPAKKRSAAKKPSSKKPASKRKAASKKKASGKTTKKKTASKKATPKKTAAKKSTKGKTSKKKASKSKAPKKKSTKKKPTKKRASTSSKKAARKRK